MIDGAGLEIARGPLIVVLRGSVSRRTSASVDVSPGLVLGESEPLVVFEGANWLLSDNFHDEVVMEVAFEPVAQEVVVSGRVVTRDDAPVGDFGEVFRG